MTKRQEGEGDLEGYEKTIEDRIKNKDGKYFDNELAAHASIIYSKFLENNKFFYLLCHNLNSIVFAQSNIVEAIKSFVKKKKGDLKIITQVQPDIESLEKYKDIFKNRDIIRTVSSSNNKKINYCVSGSMFRYEENGEVPEAIVSVYDKDISKLLRENFRALWDNTSAPK